MALKKIANLYFELDEIPPIKWSRGRIKRRYRRLTLGTYDISKNEIRIHPLLREVEIPEYVLEYVIYHELLHYQDRHKLRHPRPFWKKRRIHDKDFHQRENEFPHKKKASLVIRKLVRGQYEFKQKQRGVTYEEK